MLKFIRGIISSPTTSKIVGTTYQAITTYSPAQPKFAPVAFGGAVVAGVATMLISGYRVTDCIRYQTSQGQCDSVIEKNLPAMVSGVATLVGGWGAFNTYNPKLHTEDRLVGSKVNSDTTTLPTKELVVDREEYEPTAPHPEVILNLYQEGNSQAKVAEILGISLYAVRKALRETTGDK